MGVVVIVKVFFELYPWDNILMVVDCMVAFGFVVKLATA